MKTHETEQAYWLLRIVYGAVPIAAGFDKFTNLLTDWEQYLSPLVTRVVPASAFMHAVGIVEILAGMLVLSKLTRLGAYVVSLWLIGVALSLLTTGHYFDVAVRDLVMAAGAFALARLAEARQQHAVGATTGAPLGRAHA